MEYEDNQIINIQNIDLMYETFFKNNEFQILPAEEYKQFSVDQHRFFGNRHSLYQFPTTELIEFLKEFVIEGKTIEIGSGRGVIGKALGIPATDNKHQEWPETRRAYEKHGQPTIPYGDNVITMDANEAVDHYKPKVVIGSWVTGKEDFQGNPLNKDGMNEFDILDKVDTYIVVGNHQVHLSKDIMTVPHRRYSAPWLVSRARIPRDNSIYIWSKKPFAINIKKHKCKLKMEVIKKNDKRYKPSKSMM